VPSGICYLPLGLYHPGPSPGCLRRWGLPLCAFCFRSSAPRAFYPVPSTPGLRKSIFYPRRASTMMSWTCTDPRRPLHPPSCFTLVLCPQRRCPPELAFAVLDTPWPLPSQVTSFRPQDNLDCPRGVFPLTELGHFWGLSPLRGTPQRLLQIRIFLCLSLFCPAPSPG
jgi:hypothetical protein